MHGALDDTICAIATPPGEGGIGVVRISGLQAVDVEAQKNQADRNGDQKDDDLREMFQKD